MREGERAEFLLRADQAYGKDGLRRKGAIIVPPFATLCFDIKLVQSDQMLKEL